MARINNNSINDDIVWKKIPAREASQKFVDRLKRQLNETEQIKRESEDIQNYRYYNRDWTASSETTSLKLKQKVQEPKELIFFRCDIFEITLNREGKLINIQRALLFDLPSKEDLASWQKIKILKAPIGL